MMVKVGKNGIIKIMSKAKKIETEEELAEFERKAEAVRAQLKKNAMNRTDKSRLN